MTAPNVNGTPATAWCPVCGDTHARADGKCAGCGGGVLNTTTQEALDAIKYGVALGSKVAPTRPPAIPAFVEIEKAFQNKIVLFARLFRWRVYHTYDSRRSTPGFPDLVLVRHGRVLFAEVKSDRGRFSADQEAWLGDLSACGGVEVYRWRPADWPQIAEVLR